MNTLTRSLTVILAAAGAAAAQSAPLTKTMPGWSGETRICPAAPIVDCAPGYRPFVDPQTCAAVCLPLDKGVRPTDWTEHHPEPPKCPGCQPLPDPKPVPPRSWEDETIPLSGDLSRVKAALGRADLESAASGLLKIWSGSSKPKFLKVDCKNADGTTWGGACGTTPELPRINRPSSGGSSGGSSGSTGGGNSSGSSNGGSSSGGSSSGGNSTVPTQKSLPKQYDLPKSAIPSGTKNA